MNTLDLLQNHQIPYMGSRCSPDAPEAATELAWAGKGLSMDFINISRAHRKRVSSFRERASQKLFSELEIFGTSRNFYNVNLIFLDFFDFRHFFQKSKKIIILHYKNFEMSENFRAPKILFERLVLESY